MQSALRETGRPNWAGLKNGFALLSFNVEGCVICRDRLAFELMFKSLLAALAAAAAAAAAD